MDNPSDTEVFYICQCRHTRVRDGKSNGWNEICGGHPTMMEAIVCKESAIKQFEYARNQSKDIAKNWKTELRMVKITMIEEIMEEAEAVL